MHPLRTALSTTPQRRDPLLHHPRLRSLLEVHHGLRLTLEREGVDAVLARRGWRRAHHGIVTTWTLRRGECCTEAALASAARVDLRRWLAGLGWTRLPDGSRITHPRDRGLVLAAQLEHALADGDVQAVAA